jgi:thioredoxin 1
MLPPNSSSSEFEALIKGSELVFVDFWAPWCAPCNHFAEPYERVADEFPSIDFMKVNIEEQKKLAEVFEIRSIPHLMIFRQGIIIYTAAGNIPEDTLRMLAQQALDTDVDKIRQELDKEE